MEKIIVWIKSRILECTIGILSVLTLIFLSLWLTNVNAEEAYTCPKTESIEEEESDSKLVVDIKGAVMNPGVYYVEKNTIVQDVIILAGGLKEDADTSNLNLSKKITNEMVITVYTKKEIEDIGKLDAIYEEETTTPTNKISLNNATIEELTTLSGIGEEKAKLIIQYREKCGPFKTIEEIKNIKGIGQAMYDKIKDHITI